MSNREANKDKNPKSRHLFYHSNRTFIHHLHRVRSIAEGTEGGAIQRIVEWLTTYIFPWIFLYWFIKLVRKMK